MFNEKDKMKDKKGLEMAITTVILIILSISVLTVLVIYFNSQTGFFTRFFKTHTSVTNVDDIVSSCNALVDREGYYTYCCEIKEIKLQGEEIIRESTCDDARKEAWTGSRIRELDCVNTICSG